MDFIIGVVLGRVHDWISSRLTNHVSPSLESVRQSFGDRII